MNCENCSKGSVCKQRRRVGLKVRNLVRGHAYNLGLDYVTQRDLIEKIAGIILDQCIHCDKGGC